MGEALNNPQSISLWPVKDKVPLSRDAFERDQIKDYGQERSARCLLLEYDERVVTLEQRSNLSYTCSTGAQLISIRLRNRDSVGALITGPLDAQGWLGRMP